ncbi:Oidioi.mRNA.OKI2018_I69.chr2.g6352.t1.cds [Oikopleura dioica]|uniref:Oidioi.mRNA.OKI2018_I69.chr2.g6352.t1.cds n=1 Tax=Oikopleura dioica TaxID=34765 RepID=A0ABN7T9N9_OIKDI|nr:Oidioi.mRNA.OKI2018_I69.chr2.g6352.t1.cds [Oikopleura dioica]
MITDADVAAFTCPGIATTTASPPVVTTTAAPPVASTTVPPPVASTTAAPTTAPSTSLSCGDLSSFESSFADGTFTCDSSADSCTATCTDTSLFPYPASVVGCNAGEISPTDASSMTLTCKATSCGDPADFNYGENWVDVTATCSGETCSLTCDGDASRPVPYPVSEVSCSNGALTPPGGSEIYCAETSCGRLEDFYNVDNTGLTSTCTGDSCSLSCPAGEMPTYLTLQCDTASSTYQHVHDSQSEMVECVPEYDTPCGQIDSAFTIDKSAFNISCSGIESFYQTTPVTCDLTCADPTHTLVGESTIVCENSQFTNAGSEIRCDPPPTKTCVSFQYHDTSMAFADAEVVCANLGGYLPFFKTQEELDLYNSLPSPEIQWLGISKTDNLGGVQAADGSTQAITNWAAGEPNGHNPDFAHLPSQDCIMSKKETDPLAYQWNDVGCVGPIPKFHCRIETEVPVDQADPTDSVCYEPVGTKDCIQFELHDTPVSFADAEQACSSEGSFIAFFKTQEELDAYNTISADTTEWLGISKDGSGGFVAADGSPQTITHWASGEPNGNSFEACIESWSMTAPNGNGKKWNDTTCTLNRKFRCRKEVTIPADQNPADHYCPSV